MDTSGEVVATDTLGRRIAPRHRRTVAEKRAIVEESLTPGMSVAHVARRHEVNANQIFAWRRMYRAGLLARESSERASQLLPVKISAAQGGAEGTVRPRRTQADREGAARGVIWIEFPGGQRVKVHGCVEARVLAQVIAALVSR